jgi:hypothetical protein
VDSELPKAEKIAQHLSCTSQKVVQITNPTHVHVQWWTWSCPKQKKIEKNSSNMVKFNFLFNLSSLVEGLLLFNSLQLLSGSFRGILT